MSLTPDTLITDTATLESPILETNATEVMADPGPTDPGATDPGLAESSSTELLAAIEPNPEEAHQGFADMDTSVSGIGTPNATEQPSQEQHGSIEEPGRNKGRQRQPVFRKSTLGKLTVPLPTPAPTLALGETVTGEARKIGRRSDKKDGDGQNPVRAEETRSAKSKGVRVKSATVKNVAKANVGNQGDTRPIWEIKMLPVEAIGPNPFQPREQFSEEEMEELANSVAEHGVQTPILVRPRPLLDPQPGTDAESAPLNSGESAPVFRYELVAGERRLRASRMAGRKFIPAIVRENLSDQQAAEIALIENVQRSNLNVIEEARGYKRLMLRFRFTEARIAKKVGKSVPTVQAALKLLALPEEVQTLLLKKQLSAAHGHELLRLAPHPLICTSAALVAVAEKLPATSLASNPLPNVRELKRRGRVVELGYATKFDWKRECQECPHKAFVTSGYGSYCLLPEQWKAKQSHAIALEQEEAARVLEEARRQGEAQVEIQDLPPGSYRSLQWNEPPAGCSAGCPCRGQAADPRDASKSIPVCLDPARLESLRLAQRAAQEAERVRHYHALWKDSVQRLVPAPVPTPLSLHQPSTQDVPSVSSNGWPPEGKSHDNLLAPQGFTVLEASPAPVDGTTTNDVTTDEVTVRAHIAWNKIAPLLVLPILRGENCSYGEREQWEDKARDVALQMDIDLPWEEIMEGEEGDVLPRLEPLPPQRLLLLGVVLLLRQEAIHAGHWAGETPLLDFVLDLRSARQSELEASETQDSASQDDTEFKEDAQARDETDEARAGTLPVSDDVHSVPEV